MELAVRRRLLSMVFCAVAMTLAVTSVFFPTYLPGGSTSTRCSATCLGAHLILSTLLWRQRAESIPWATREGRLSLCPRVALGAFCRRQPVGRAAQHRVDAQLVDL